jgi:hypothetical protein
VSVLVSVLEERRACAALAETAPIFISRSVNGDGYSYAGNQNHGLPNSVRCSRHRRSAGIALAGPQQRNDAAYTHGPVCGGSRDVHLERCHAGGADGAPTGY